MKENKYYITTEKIYGMDRKSFIYITKVCKKVFFFSFLSDWTLIEVEGKTKLNITGQARGNYRGKLADKDSFKQLTENSYIINF